jgi:FkbM family methyltransferase
VSLAAGRRAGPEGHVYSFEPSRYNYAYLKRHIEWNASGNVTPVNLGVAGEPGWADFGGSGSSQTFRIGGGRERTKITSLAEMMRSGYRAPDVLKIDAEGAESDILRDGATHLPPTCALAVSIHSHEDYRACVVALRAAGFTVFASDGVLEVRDLAVWRGDPDLIAFGPAHRPSGEPPAELRGFAAL